MIDLHFHGAWGIDLMTASPEHCDQLAQKLWDSGVDAFCPTTLSADAPSLRKAVATLGKWISDFQEAPAVGRAYPLGIHLEGPFLSAAKAGAHAPSTLRPCSLAELDDLYRISQGTLRLITLASEDLSEKERKSLGKWAQAHQVTLSLGHTRATEAEARQAFQAGFRGITHAWNAMSFHHRDGGPLAGAFSSETPVHVEIIPDGVHLSPSVARMTLELFGDRGVWVSDCVPAAGLKPGAETEFGPIRVKREPHSCTVVTKGRDSGTAAPTLAGGATPLPETLHRVFPALLEGWELRASGNLKREALRILEAGCEAPLRYLGVSLPRSHRQKRLNWKLTP